MFDPWTKVPVPIDSFIVRTMMIITENSIGVYLGPNESRKIIQLKFLNLFVLSICSSSLLVTSVTMVMVLVRGKESSVLTLKRVVKKRCVDLLIIHTILKHMYNLKVYIAMGDK
ncbi:hypothetical protein PHYBLDRAFT_67971 [Phycomyces blakesleeanus NRRL 1555(-)]|uniref:Uncharacterized protein n=1 Tax=Phycomyces blakesleeanus (strain ATCC 8743b / DSM 1359 / FGSC 10004 / NBRC 33097 / NRRL 1555) TaxID=763407 RepID=A0A167P4B5_PHYB8|nr:hypothetical protein PHYBLDRAFT_67971 [Phycomyces blakesleeanus NRRL 1555(-)]OAD77221.1 hypothetical protein PHYBLDRAFT_67971 [Phycomyces blakesleeanus NRRL 1555(-)]|eukprot:XP_018295261.1 hypothetical protein PHYBLDRAFT_67971 [Phycomyces blakesleeanus NRRL 1555(-)]